MKLPLQSLPHGAQAVGASNPLAPTSDNERSQIRICNRFCFYEMMRNSRRNENIAWRHSSGRSICSRWPVPGIDS